MFNKNTHKIIYEYPKETLPDGCKVLGGYFEEGLDGSIIPEEDVMNINLPNGYNIDIGAYGLDPKFYDIKVTIQELPFGCQDLIFEKICIDNAQECIKTIEKLVRKWMKMKTVDPRIIEGFKALWEWGWPY